MFLKIIKYCLYGIGIILVFVSFLFFGRAMNTYNELLIVGLLIAAIGLGTILFVKSTRKEKFSFVGLTIILMFLQYISEPYLIHSSYKIYLSNNRAELDEMTNILSKSDTTFWIADEIPNCDLSLEELEHVINLKNKADVNYISVSEDYIYFEIWGRLDVRHGVSYFHSNSVADSSGYCNLEGNWYN
jgi:hypothetical protein